MSLFKRDMETPATLDQEMARQLRQLLEQVERGEIHEIIVTVFRRDGRIEHLGNFQVCRGNP